MIRRTRLGLIGKIHLFLLRLSDVSSKARETSDLRIDHAAVALEKAETTFSKATRVFNVHKAIMLVGTGGAGSAEEIAYNPEFTEDFRDMMHLQHKILTNEKHRADLRASVNDLRYFEHFFRESLYRCLQQKKVHADLSDVIVSYHRSEKPVSDFPIHIIDQIIDGSADQLAKDYGYTGPILEGER